MNRIHLLLTIVIWGLSSCSLVDKEAIIGTWVCEDFEFIRDPTQSEIRVPQKLINMAEKAAKKKVLIFHDDEECSEETYGATTVDTYYEIDEEEEMLYIFNQRYRGKRSKAKVFDIVQLTDEEMTLGYRLYGEWKVNFIYYKED